MEKQHVGADDFAAPKISIVTISFNQAEFLEDALRSVLNQDYPNLEYIVVDPGSTDGSRAIIERYRDRLAKVIFEPDNGPADGLNRGFAAATGEIFGYLNSDDALLPGAIRRMADVFRQNPGADVVYGHGYIANEQGNIIRALRANPFNLRRAAFGSCFIMQQATFFTREAFVAVGGFNTNNRTCWDTELWFDFAIAGKHLRRADEYWALFRDQKNSISRNFHSTASDRHAIFERDYARCFEKAIRRKSRKSDAILRRLFRVEKWLTDPRSFLIRLWPKDYKSVAKMEFHNRQP